MIYHKIYKTLSIIPIISNELSEWIIYQRGWCFVLVSFLIAIMDSFSWIYTGDSRIQTRFEHVMLLIGLSYLLFKESRLSKQEILWSFWRLSVKEPHKAYWCINITVFSILFGNIYIIAVIFVIFFKIWLDSLSTNTLFGKTEISLKIIKLLRYGIFTCLTIIWSKNFLEILFMPRSTINKIFYSIFEFLFWLTVLLLSPLTVALYNTYNVYIDHLYVKKQTQPYYRYLLHLWELQKIYCSFLLSCLIALSPICLHCGLTVEERNWCQKCGIEYFINNFKTWTSGNEAIDEIIREIQLNTRNEFEYIEWIPYDKFENIIQIGKGGFGTVYSAMWKSGNLYRFFGKIERQNNQQIVAIKSLGYSDNVTNEYLNELKAFIRCATTYSSDFYGVVRCYGLTQDPISKAYMIIMDLKENGNLFQYLQNNFSSLKWNEDKLRLLVEISCGLRVIHEVNLVHHDFHTGNILIGYDGTAYLADLGLSCPSDEKPSDSGIYGVLPFVAPEVLRGYQYTTASDIYSFGMIMWVLTSNQNPFSDRKQDSSLALEIISKNKRPPIIEGIPECYIDLMKKCWDPNPLKRPSAIDLENTFRRWYFSGEFYNEFKQADKIILNNIIKIIQENQNQYNTSENIKMTEQLAKSKSSYNESEQEDSSQMELALALDDVDFDIDNETHETQESESQLTSSKFISFESIKEAAKSKKINLG